MCVKYSEPVLLAGETGTGKTTLIQHLAQHLNRTLTVVNMSTQSDASDLVGGYRPVDGIALEKLKLDFIELFSNTFNSKSNASFLEAVEKHYKQQNIPKLKACFFKAIKMAQTLFEKNREGELGGKRKTRKIVDDSVILRWEEFESAVSTHSSTNTFAFVEGVLIKVAREGGWILLDEINLAPVETLAQITNILKGRLTLENSTQPIPIAEGFMVFACMNPANDAGKRELPISLRNEFVEIWVDSPCRIRTDLILIIKTYLFTSIPPGPAGDQILNSIADFYVGLKDSVLYDCEGEITKFTLRTLTRALKSAVSFANVFGVMRGIYEGICMCFVTALCLESKTIVESLIYGTLLKQIKMPSKWISQTSKLALDPSLYVSIGPYRILKGGLEIPLDSSDFIVTPSILANLEALARCVMHTVTPVLIQGPTSAGKTSMIRHLANITGHRFLRINNHEHTDIQEYVGAIQSTPEGLKFVEVLY